MAVAREWRRNGRARAIGDARGTWWVEGVAECAEGGPVECAWLVRWESESGRTSGSRGGTRTRVTSAETRSGEVKRARGWRLRVWFGGLVPRSTRERERLEGERTIARLRVALEAHAAGGVTRLCTSGTISSHSAKYMNPSMGTSPCFAANARELKSRRGGSPLRRGGERGGEEEVEEEGEEVGVSVPENRAALMRALTCARGVGARRTRCGRESARTGRCSTGASRTLEIASEASEGREDARMEGGEGRRAMERDG